MPKISTETIVNVLIALVIFKVLDKLFLDSVLTKVTGHIEEAFEKQA